MFFGSRACRVPVISPLAQARKTVCDMLNGNVHIVHCQIDIPTLEQRDPKGLYEKAKEGLMPDLVGYGQTAVPFEPPEDAAIVLETSKETPHESTNRLLNFIMKIVDTQAAAG